MADFEDIPEAEDEIVEIETSEVEEEQQQFSLPDPEPAEEDHLATFIKEWNIKLEQKRQLEFEKEQAVRKLADEEKTNWVSQRDIKMKSKMENNRSEEELFKEQLQSETENLKTWERVSKLIDAGEGVDMKEGYDTSRMHKLFIQLKNEPLESTRAE